MINLLKLQYKGNLGNYLYLLALWIIAALIINPLGEFPLNDDWAYASDVYNLSQLGTFKLSDWPAMNLIAQTLWGSLVSLVFSFSFINLRLSVFVLAIIGSLIFYKILNKIIDDKALCFLFTALLIFNPLFFSLSFTFMTDVPFLILLILTFYSLAKYLNFNKLKFIFAATVFAILATMIRQLGIYIGIAAAATILITQKTNRRHLIYLLLLAILPVGVSAIYNFILDNFNLQRASHLSFSDAFLTVKSGEAFKDFGYRYATILFFFGIFMLPASLYLFPTYWKNNKPLKRWLVLLISILLSLFIIPHLHYIFTGNIFYNLGLGPKTLKDAYSGFNINPHITSTSLTVFKIIGIISSMLFLFTLINALIILKFKNLEIAEKIKLMGAIVVFGYLGFLFIDINFFDRYFLMLVPFVIVLIVPLQVVKNLVFSKLALFSLLIIGSFNIMATHDYFSWNRARWKAINNLLKQGISPNNIDGGFEFNGWYATGKQNEKTVSGKSWWFVNDDTYVLSFGKLCGFKKITSYKYNNYLNFSMDSICVLKKTDKDTLSIFTDFDKTTRDNKFYLTSDSGFLINYNKFSNSAIAHSGQNSVMLDSVYQYGVEMNFHDVLPCEIIKVKFWIKNIDAKASIVFTHKNGKIFYYCAEIQNDKSGAWQYAEIEAEVPIDYPSKDLIIYFWRISGFKFYIDDLQVVRIGSEIHSNS